MRRIWNVRLVLVSICLLATGLAFVNPASSSTGSGPTVDGWVIRLADDGWYQVQTGDGSQEVCQGRNSCDVKANGFGAGEYLVINLTTGKRHPLVTVTGDSTGTPVTEAAPSKPVIIQALKKSSFVSVSWRPQPTVRQFDVFRNGGYVGTVFPPNNVFQDTGGQVNHRYTVTAFNHEGTPSETSEIVFAKEGNGCDPTGRRQPISNINVSLKSAESAQVNFTGDCGATSHQVLLWNGDTYLGSKSVRGGNSSVSFVIDSNRQYSIETVSVFGEQRVDGQTASFGAVPLSKTDAEAVARNAPSAVQVLVLANESSSASDQFGDSKIALIVTLGTGIPGSTAGKIAGAAFAGALGFSLSGFVESSEEYFETRDEFDRVLDEVMASESLPAVPDWSAYGDHDPSFPEAREWKEFYSALPDMIAKEFVDGDISPHALAAFVTEQIERFEKKWGAPVGQNRRPGFGQRPDPTKPSECWYSGAGCEDLLDLDDDRDGDGIPNDIDRYPDTYSRDDDSDGVPDNIDWDVDDDGVPNYLDPDYANPPPGGTTGGSNSGSDSSSNSGSGNNSNTGQTGAHPTGYDDGADTGGTF